MATPARGQWIAQGHRYSVGVIAAAAVKAKPVPSILDCSRAGYWIRCCSPQSPTGRSTRYNTATIASISFSWRKGIVAQCTQNAMKKSAILGPWPAKVGVSPREVLGPVPLQVFIRGYGPMIAASVQRDVDGILKRFHLMLEFARAVDLGSGAATRENARKVLIDVVAKANVIMGAMAAAQRARHCNRCPPPFAY